MTSTSRVGTANLYDNTIRNLQAQQTSLAQQQEHLSAGKRVLRPSDDPVAAAQAERARTRISRNETDLRALQAQQSSMALAESTLGSAMNAMQSFRALVVQAGNDTLTQKRPRHHRAAIARFARPDSWLRQCQGRERHPLVPRLG